MATHSPEMYVSKTEVFTEGDVLTDVILGAAKLLRTKMHIKMTQTYFDEIKTNASLWFHAYFRIIRTETNSVHVKRWSSTVVGSISTWGRSFWVRQTWSRASDAGCYGPGVAFCYQPIMVINNTPPTSYYTPYSSSKFAVGPEHYFLIA